MLLMGMKHASERAIKKYDAAILVVIVVAPSLARLFLAMSHLVRVTIVACHI